jgi:hypothetical protein
MLEVSGGCVLAIQTYMLDRGIQDAEKSNEESQ